MYVSEVGSAKGGLEATYECICRGGEQGRGSGRDGGIQLDDEQAEVAREAGVDREPDFAPVLEIVFGFESFFIVAAQVGVDEGVLAVICVRRQRQRPVSGRHGGLKRLPVQGLMGLQYFFTLVCLREESLLVDSARPTSSSL
jgi:hypothetical protein